MKKIKLIILTLLMSSVTMALPVKLTLFNYDVKNSDVVLKWVTEWEFDQIFFEVERDGGDGKGFLKIGNNIRGIGGNYSNFYQYTDRNVFAPYKIIRYRLRVRDLYNNGGYSEILDINKIYLEYKYICTNIEHKVILYYKFTYNDSIKVNGFNIQGSDNHINYYNIGEVKYSDNNYYSYIGNNDYIYYRIGYIGQLGEKFSDDFIESKWCDTIYYSNVNNTQYPQPKISFNVKDKKLLFNGYYELPYRIINNKGIVVSEGSNIYSEIDINHFFTGLYYLIINDNSYKFLVN